MGERGNEEEHERDSMHKVDLGMNLNSEATAEFAIGQYLDRVIWLYHQIEVILGVLASL
jgi:hypothetical protein